VFVMLSSTPPSLRCAALADGHGRAMRDKGVNAVNGAATAPEEERKG
jgi:hypothetical protein